MNKHRSAWDDPNVKDALKERPPSDIALLCCQRCGNFGYYGQVSHFSCSVEGCNWSASGEDLEALIDDDEFMTLADLESSEGEF